MCEPAELLQDDDWFTWSADELLDAEFWLELLLIERPPMFLPTEAAAIFEGNAYFTSM